MKDTVIIPINREYFQKAYIALVTDRDMTGLFGVLKNTSKPERIFRTIYWGKKYKNLYLFCDKKEDNISLPLVVMYCGNKNSNENLIVQTVVTIDCIVIFAYSRLTNGLYFNTFGVLDFISFICMHNSNFMEIEAYRVDKLKQKDIERFLEVMHNPLPMEATINLL